MTSNDDWFCWKYDIDGSLLHCFGDVSKDLKSSKKIDIFSFLLLSKICIIRFGLSLILSDHSKFKYMVTRLCSIIDCPLFFNGTLYDWNGSLW